MIETILQHTEQLQELLDRRARLLKDLQHVDEEIRGAYLIVMGTEPSTVAALPHSAAPANGTTRRGRPPGKSQKALAAPANASKPAKANAKPGKKTTPRATSRQRPKKGESRDAVIGVLKSNPKRGFTAREMAEVLGWERTRAANALNHLFEAGGVQKPRAGVFQHKKLG